MMRDISAELHHLSIEESASAGDPTSVARAVANRARVRRGARASVLGTGSLAAVAAVAVAGATMGGRLGGGETTLGAPTASPSPSPTADAMVPVNFDFKTVFAEFWDYDVLPGCGEAVDFGAVDAHGINLVVEPASNRGLPGVTEFYAQFRNDSDEELTFIASPVSYVLVKDGVVINDPADSIGTVQPFDADAGEIDHFWERMQVGFHDTCDARHELDALRGESLWDEMSDRDVAQQMEAVEEIYSRSLTPGEYTVYGWSPVMFGPQAGAARVFKESGVRDLGTLMDVGSGADILDTNPDLAQYCSTTVRDAATGEETVLEGVLPDWDGPSGMEVTVDGVTWELLFHTCDVPDEVFADATTRLVPSEYINNYEMTYVVSEPVTFVVE